MMHADNTARAKETGAGMLGNMRKEKMGHAIKVRECGASMSG